MLPHDLFISLLSIRRLIYAPGLISPLSSRGLTAGPRFGQIFHKNNYNKFARVLHALPGPRPPGMTKATNKCPITIIFINNINHKQKRPIWGDFDFLELGYLAFFNRLTPCFTIFATKNRILGFRTLLGTCTFITLKCFPFKGRCYNLFIIPLI